MLQVNITPKIDEKHDSKRAGSRTKEMHSPSMFEDEKINSQVRSSFIQNRKSMLDLR